MLLKLVPQDTNIPFVNFRKIAYVFSVLMIVASIGLFFTKELNFGIDFKGGFLIEAHLDKTADLAHIRGLTGDLDLGDVSIQTFGADNQILIRIEEHETMSLNEVVNLVQSTLEAGVDDNIVFQRTESVGSVVSGELIQSGIMSVGLAIGAVLFYIWIRFEWQFGLGAVIALVHDIILTIGMFALTQLEFNLSIIAAILTIVGYSLNDTVVVYDRIRENLRKYRKKEMPELINFSLNETLARTVMTSVTTLIALASLYFLGGEAIRGFTAAMIWGIFVGTYSSVFIASPVLLWFEIRREEEEEMTKDGKEIIPEQFR
ncbi:protein translocase subunit SecF [Pseudemcibacter aquimaris]|uniref:protein translocase subunit SecF n=1 Tax=Pseudemcibacter aquimaris TaxID=2857064 RepID=UPI002012E09F|nr:protein translocase subunit SecF [Pseudemcibacter aquimaris]MCC3860129.1 protein translocase subunit SecF [Pseudemcibacter aquimaris]WDU57456.1 protein translocase subunit SecF [Pseudemcibacter aquimaris]